MKENDLLTAKACARQLCVSESTLSAWRRQLIGPTFMRLGRTIRYRQTDVEKWINGFERVVP